MACHGIAYYAEYILIVTLIMTNFTEIIKMVQTSISNLVGFMNSLIPILMALVNVSGSIATANLIQPIILFIIIFIGNSITITILPIVTVATIIAIVSNISEKVQLGKISQFLKSGVVWVLGTVVTVFVAVLSLEGTLTSSVDGVSVKGIKAITSNVVPVVGKSLSDSVDTVLASTSILKNAVGVMRNDSAFINLCYSYNKTIYSNCYI